MTIRVVCQGFSPVEEGGWDKKLITHDPTKALDEKEKRFSRYVNITKSLRRQWKLPFLQEQL